MVSVHLQLRWFNSVKTSGVGTINIGPVAIAAVAARRWGINCTQNGDVMHDDEAHRAMRKAVSCQEVVGWSQKEEPEGE